MSVLLMFQIGTSDVPNSVWQSHICVTHFPQIINMA
jgi:hypothetical protein